ncbi:hypothetical protein BLA23254_06745 [Burkholderia lata]|uniref:Uncharacterized protein n=1 Tax=Burkholderia lata (strain ATCC 17760 / DSM 23089 / LMG 22485 / NCIMB 9086 / R18194 / 383) TaxID=482957 RepID=A0A6P2RM18_BURL3|nr:hypothetical protein BLA23254_06745 [Burkholderia lata]
MFVDDLYNARFMHSSVGYLPPNRFEELLAQQGA